VAGTNASYTGRAFALLLALSTLIRDWINMISFKVNCVLTVETGETRGKEATGET